MRRDLGFQISEYLVNPDKLKHKIQFSISNINVARLLESASLRLTVNSSCNFNCRAPGTQEGWCMEKPSEYTYPKIRTSLLK